MDIDKLIFMVIVVALLALVETLTMPEKQLSMILEKDGFGNPLLWICRGVGRGCQRNTYRQRKTHCDDCIAAVDQNETIGDLYKRVNRWG